MASPFKSSVDLRITRIVIDTETLGRVSTLAEVWNMPVQRVLATLIERGLRDAEAYAVCRVCGCCEWDACVDEENGETCGWAAEDLCSRCADKPANG